ncbi:MAG: mucoidy inhibitor MuiA family protein [Aureispira sp.]|nr:mucoidy inhibitor MuiA family protein [Aureispira sp.]
MNYYWKAVLLLIATIYSQQNYAQTKTKVKSTVQHVKIHLQGAEVTRTATLNLAVGKQELVFTGLTPKLLSQTIRVSPSQRIDVLSISSKTNFLKRHEESSEIKGLRDSVKQQKRKIYKLQSKISAYEKQKEILQNNQSIKGSDKTLEVDDLEKVTTFFFKEIERINDALFDLEERIEKAYQRLFDYKLQLYELNASRQPTSEISIIVEATKATECSFDLRYIVDDAGWAPIYDLYAGEIDKPVNLKYRARAYNNTGVDWNDVKLTLSTADPIQSATQPAINVWEIGNGYEVDYSIEAVKTVQRNQDLNPYRGNTYKRSKYGKPVLVGGSINIEFVMQIMGGDYEANVDYNTDYYRQYVKNQKPKKRVGTKMIHLPDQNTDFKIAKPYTIPSDQKPYSIYINESKLNASYEYYSAPKLELSAYLVAKLVNWEDMDLISGAVNLYNKNEYIGQSYIDTRSVDDTLFVSLGRDPNIVVSRMKVSGSKKKVFLGNSHKLSIAYNMTVKNHHNKAIEIVLEDQIPISDDKDIVINLTESSDANYEEEIGLLNWRLTLAPGEERTVQFAFSVKYPKGKKVRFKFSGKGRALGCPSF